MGLNTRTIVRVPTVVLAVCLGAASTGAMLLAGCSGGSSGSSVPSGTQPHGVKHRAASTPIQHVVVIIQENRTVDNIFNGFPGADTTRTGYDSNGNQHTLRQISFSNQCGPSHSHQQFVTEFNGGGMNGWDLASIACRNGYTLPDGAFAYVSPSETAGYWNVAKNYALADEVFQTNEGPSFPAHQYLIAGQSGGHGSDGNWAFAENGPGSSSHSDPFDEGGETGGHGCGGSQNADIVQIDMTSSYPGNEGNPTVPCKDYQTIFDLAMAQSPSLSWAYYAHRSGNLWSGVDAVQHLWQAGHHSITPETQVLTDIANHNLANIVYVTPSPRNSDHPHSSAEPAKAGPLWVAQVVNAIGQSSYWNNTTILVTWDDWGGWFDHAVYQGTMHPASNPADPYEYGFRVPLIVISPYVQAHMVDHTQRTFDSVMAYIEATFGLGSVGQQDTTTDDLSDMFNYGQTPLSFSPMPTH